MLNIIKRLFSIFFIVFLIYCISLFFKNETLKNNDDLNYHIVNLSPCGDVKFKAIPKSAISIDVQYNDILVSLGMIDTLKATAHPGCNYNGFYNTIGVENFNGSNMNYFRMGRNNYDKEIFYKIKADVHFIDPEVLSRTKGWSKSDVDEIIETIGPFFGNTYSLENKKPDFLIDYKFYDTYELSEKVAEVYKQQNKIVKINNMTKDMVNMILSKLPPYENRPRVGLVYITKIGVLPFNCKRTGISSSHFYELNTRDAFDEAGLITYEYEGSMGNALDSESLLKANPDILFIVEGIYGYMNQDDLVTIRAKSMLKQINELKNDPICGKINAFKNGFKVFYSGTRSQGPIFHLFQLEMTAKQIYPSIFGKYNKDNIYSKNEQLFDRKELLNILHEK